MTDSVLTVIQLFLVGENVCSPHQFDDLTAKLSLPKE